MLSCGTGIGIGILIIINLLHDYIFPRSAFFNLSFVWKEGLHDQVPVIVTVQLQTPLCFLLSCGRAFGSVAKRYNDFGLHPQLLELEL